MGIETGFATFKDLFIYSSVFNMDLLFAVFVMFIGILLISREPSDWPLLVLPSTILTRLIGLRPPLWLYFIGLILFVVYALSIYSPFGAMRTVAFKSAKIGSSGIKSSSGAIGGLFKSERRQLIKKVDRKRKEKKLLKMSDEEYGAQKSLIRRIFR